jgi:hypothetical protein
MRPKRILYFAKIQFNVGIGGRRGLRMSRESPVVAMTTIEYLMDNCTVEDLRCLSR